MGWAKLSSSRCGWAGHRHADKKCGGWGRTKIVEVSQMGSKMHWPNCLLLSRTEIAGWAAGQYCRTGGLVHVNISLYSAVIAMRETCSRARVHVSQDRVTTSLLLLQQCITDITCPPPFFFSKGNLQKECSVNAHCNGSAPVKLLPASIYQILEKPECLSLKKSWSSEWGEG